MMKKVATWTEKAKKKIFKMKVLKKNTNMDKSFEKIIKKNKNYKKSSNEVKKYAGVNIRKVSEISYGNIGLALTNEEHTCLVTKQNSISRSHVRRSSWCKIKILKLF